MPVTLVLDCVGTACSVALFDGSSLIDEGHVELGRGHAERLVPMIAALLGNGRADTIAFNAGPGSFTGVRIGLSVARALAMAWDAELIGYSAMDLVAARARADGLLFPLCVVLHGGHGEFFTQNFDAAVRAEGPVASLSPEAVARASSGRHAVGNGVGAPSLVLLGLTGSDIATRAADFILLPKSSLVAPLPQYGRAPDAVMKGAQ